MYSDNGLTSDEELQIASEVAARHGNPKPDTAAWQVAHLDYLTAITPIREVGIEWWFLVHKTALLRAMRTCDIKVPGMSNMDKNALIRLCMPILRGGSSLERTQLLATIRREADTHEIAVRGKPLRNPTPEQQLAKLFDESR